VEPPQGWFTRPVSGRFAGSLVHSADYFNIFHMSSLSSSMFAGYNKFDDAKVRIGSWREELAMKELTGVTRLANPRNKAVFNATGVR